MHVKNKQIKYTVHIRYPDKFGYRIANLRLNRIFNIRTNMVAIFFLERLISDPDIGHSFYSISQLKYVRISAFSGYWASG